MKYLFILQQSQTVVITENNVTLLLTIKSYIMIIYNVALLKVGFGGNVELVMMGPRNVH